jgi:hypothetical protein
MNQVFGYRVGLLAVKIGLILFFPISVLIKLFRFLFTEWIQDCIQHSKMYFYMVQREMLFRLPQDYRSILKEPDSHGLYHNKDYLNDLNLADLLKNWTIEQLADLSNEVCRRNDSAISVELYNDAVEFLQAKGEILDFEAMLYDSSEADLWFLSKLKEHNFFANYKDSPINATAIGNVAFLALNGNPACKMLAYNIYLAWKERAGQLTI